MPARACDDPALKRCGERLRKVRQPPPSPWAKVSPC